MKVSEFSIKPLTKQNCEGYSQTRSNSQTLSVSCTSINMHIETDTADDTFPLLWSKIRGPQKHTLKSEEHLIEDKELVMNQHSISLKEIIFQQ